MDKEPLPLSNQKRSFDVCVVCAMAEEAKAFMEVAKTLGASDFQQAFSSANLLYHYTTINNRKEELLNLQVSWQTSYGPLEAGLHMQRILDEFKPGFIGMTGICAGDKRKVVLGDIIVAERAFLSDTGKFLMDTTGSRYQEYDTETHPLHSKLLHFIRGFEGWKPNVANLARPMSLHQQCDWLLKTLLEETTSSIDKIGLQILNQYAPDWRKIVQMLQKEPGAYLTRNRTLKNPTRVLDLLYGAEIFPYKDPESPRVHIAPMASGSAVRADRPFDDIHVPVRGTVAVDMEGASFYHSAADFPSTHALLVKGVADYADSEKDDSYHTYAAAASAAYMLSLIKEYVIPTHQPVVSGRTTLPITGGTTPATSQNSPQSMSEQVETEPPKDVFNLFYSYAPEDEALRQKLEKHLKLLQRQGYIADLYGEHKVDVGIDEEQQMNRHLTQSKLILLLLSSSFLASETCHDQMVLALKMQDAGKARVIPILLRPTDDLADTPVGKLRSLPRNNKAITSGGDLDTAFSEIAREIRAIIKLLRE